MSASADARIKEDSSMLTTPGSLFLLVFLCFFFHDSVCEQGPRGMYKIGVNLYFFT